jgi:hypothetical protein
MSGIPSWAVRGAKVVCVLDFTTARTVNDLGYTAIPIVGQAYTVRRAYICRYGVPVIALREFEVDQYFDLRGFRPAVALKTESEDLAHFRHHLDQRQPVDA